MPQPRKIAQIPGGLAALLETMINAAMLPEWAFRRGATPAT